MAASAISTGVLVASTLVFTGINYIDSIQVFTDGTNAATVSVYDNTSAAGKIAAQVLVPGATLHNSVTFRIGVRMDTGIFIAISGTGASAIVTYGSAG